MRQRTRFNDRTESGGAGSGPAETGQGSDNLSHIRRQGESFLKAAEDAIRNALSGDSQAFLSQSRQHGGQ